MGEDATASSRGVDNPIVLALENAIAFEMYDMCRGRSSRSCTLTLSDSGVCRASTAVPPLFGRPLPQSLLKGMHGFQERAVAKSLWEAKRCESTVVLLSARENTRVLPELPLIVSKLLFLWYC
jgi:hypothetical protein